MTTAITFYGMHQFVGQTASVTIVGLDCGNYVVASDGSVTVPYESDPDGLLTADYLISRSADPPDPVYGWGELAATFCVTSSGDVLTEVTLPVVVGFNFVSDGQIVRPMTSGEVKSPLGAALGKTRRNHMYGALLTSTQGISFGGDFTNLREAEFQTPDGAAYEMHTLFSGVWWDLCDDDYGFDGMLSWRIARPYPATVAAVSGYIMTEDR